jgi:hypothetical protein
VAYERLRFTDWDIYEACTHVKKKRKRGSQNLHFLKNLSKKLEKIGPRNGFEKT